MQYNNYCFTCIFVSNLKNFDRTVVFNKATYTVLTTRVLLCGFRVKV